MGGTCPYKYKGQVRDLPLQDLITNFYYLPWTSRKRRISFSTSSMVTSVSLQ